jgi:hypothetical protein
LFLIHHVHYDGLYLRTSSFPTAVCNTSDADIYLNKAIFQTIPSGNMHKIFPKQKVAYLVFFLQISVSVQDELSPSEIFPFYKGLGGYRVRAGH